MHERRSWDAYQQAFSEVLSNTSTDWAPWYVIPADDKPLARVAAAGVIANALIEIDPRYPVVSEEARQALLDARDELEAEGTKAPTAASASVAAADKSAASTTGRGTASARWRQRRRWRRTRWQHHRARRPTPPWAPPPGTP